VSALAVEAALRAAPRSWREEARRGRADDQGGRQGSQRGVQRGGAGKQVTRMHSNEVYGVHRLLSCGTEGAVPRGAGLALTEFAAHLRQPGTPE
jgi:hypothetical protein